MPLNGLTERLAFSAVPVDPIENLLIQGEALAHSDGSALQGSAAAARFWSTARRCFGLLDGVHALLRFGSNATDRLFRDLIYRCLARALRHRAEDLR